MTDGLKGYLGGPIDQSKHGVCLVHGIRPMKKHVKFNPNDPVAFKILMKASQVFTIEKEFHAMLNSLEITPKQFLAKRKKATTKVLDELFVLVEACTDYKPKDSFASAIGYLQNYREYFYKHLDCVECTPDNNICELKAKPFAVGRSDWLLPKMLMELMLLAFFTLSSSLQRIMESIQRSILSTFSHMARPLRRKTSVLFSLGTLIFPRQMTSLIRECMPVQIRRELMHTCSQASATDFRYCI